MPDKKWTPLQFAVDSKHPKIVSMLLRRGADMQREDEEKCVPELLVNRNRAPECRQIITQHVSKHDRSRLPQNICLRLQYPNNLGCPITRGMLRKLLDQLRNVSGLTVSQIKVFNITFRSNTVLHCNLPCSQSFPPHSQWWRKPGNKATLQQKSSVYSQCCIQSCINETGMLS